MAPRDGFSSENKCIYVATGEHMRIRAGTSATTAFGTEHSLMQRSSTSPRIVCGYSAYDAVEEEVLANRRNA